MKRAGRQAETKPSSSRVSVLKTYKLFVGGAFPRSESERTYPLRSARGTLVAHACCASRKDLKNAVTAARKGYESWSVKTAYNRAQIIYRMAEMLESRREQYERELTLLGASTASARNEVDQAIDCIVHYAGWADKAQQLLASINPVSGPYFNFSTAEPLGVVGLITPEAPAFLEMIRAILPAVAVGNAVIVLSPEQGSSVCLSFGEVLVASDLPGGVVNILSGHDDELLPQVGLHLEIDALYLGRGSAATLNKLRVDGAENMKRLIYPTPDTLHSLQCFSEIKTTWHPIAV